MATREVETGVEGARDANYTSTLANAKITATDSLHYYRLKGPLLDQGRVNIPVSKTENMAVVLKVYAAGGEGDLHCHNYEDHNFLILQGSMRFYDGDETPRDLAKNEAVMIPAGTHYRFDKTGEENLVLLRTSCPVNSEVPWGRSATDGSQYVAGKPGPEKLPAIIRDGEFFE